MLPKSKRLNLKTDFKHMIGGKFINSKYAKLYLRMGDNHPPIGGPKIGIATSSKIFKKAVDRNRARRLISAAIEPLYGRLPLNINILALPKISILSVKSGDILINLEQVLIHDKIIS